MMFLDCIGHNACGISIEIIIEKKRKAMNEEIQVPQEKGGQVVTPLIKEDHVSMKVLIVGVPVFIVQLIAVYFITANILLNKIEGTPTAAAASEEVFMEEEGVEEDSDSTNQANVTLGEFIYSVDDIIVNPAGTNGQQLLLTSIAFDLSKEEDLKKLKGKEVVIKDMIISVLSSKNITMLSNTTYKDSLRTEISTNLQNFIPNIKVNKVYFSKYIIN